MECAARLGIQRIQAKGDSLLVVKQMKGEWDCNKPHLRVLLQKALDARSKFKELSIVHVKRDENHRADRLANAAMDERLTDLGQHESNIKPCSTFDDQELEDELVSLKIPYVAQKDMLGLSQGSDEVPKANTSFDDQELEEVLSTMIIPCLEQKANDAYTTAEEQSWLSELPFLARFEIQRFNLQNNQRLQDSISSSNGINEVISAIYKEVKPSAPEDISSKQEPPYEHFLKHCLKNGFKVDEGNSCLFLFHAKLTTDGVELLAPEPADVQTRRIHRCYGSHRFLDLRLDEKWDLKTLKKYMTRFFTADKKLLIAGRQYGILYSNPSEIPVIFRLFAESGVGIDKCVSASEVAARCIPPKPINPELSLSRYMKRMQLSFTPSVPSLRLDRHQLEAITDIHGNGGCNMTDGCGLISRDALNKVYN